MNFLLFYFILENRIELSKQVEMRIDIFTDYFFIKNWLTIHLMFY